MIDLIEIKSISRIADWIELNVVYSVSPMSRTKLIAILEDNGYEDDQDYNGEELFDSILQELQFRADLYGAKTPYRIQNNIIEPLADWKSLPEYVMCLLFSYLGAENVHSGTKLFERLSNEALRSYLGGNTLTLGFPNAEALTVQLDKTAASLCEQRGNRNPAPEDKDRGVDVIGWKPFSDNRNSQIIVLMQCAAGRNWKLKKQIPLPVWSQFIHWNYTTTIPCLSITEVVEGNAWQKRVDEYGIILDRPRIFKHIYADSFAVDAGLRQEILDWCIQKLN